MATGKKALGKGLDILIPNKISTTTEKKTEAVAEKTVRKPVEKKADVYISINKIEPNREQPRKYFNEDSLEELADSIRQFGILQPLLVEKKKDYYEIVAGERRWRAAKKAGLKEVPVILKALTEQQKLEISLIENIQRENLNPIEEAQAFKRLLNEFNLKQDEIAERVSKSRTAVTNSMRLLKLDEKVQQMVIDDMLSVGHARAILGIEDNEKQYATAQKIFDEKMSVRDTEKLVKQYQNGKNEKPKAKVEKDTQQEAIYEDLQEKLKEILGTKVTINKKDSQKGKIEIEYYSMDELNRLVELFHTIKN